MTDARYYTARETRVESVFFVLAVSDHVIIECMTDGFPAPMIFLPWPLQSLLLERCRYVNRMAQSRAKYGVALCALYQGIGCAKVCVLRGVCGACQRIDLDIAPKYARVGDEEERSVRGLRSFPLAPRA